MNWNTRIRQIHRGLSIAFTVAVIITVATTAAVTDVPEQTRG